MNVLTCPEVLDRLEAFHDEELPVSDQISVSTHVSWCRECGAEFAELELMRASLRAGAPGRTLLSGADADGLRSSVVNRVKAEQSVSFGAQVHDMFEDMHFVFAGLGAAAAALVSVVIMLGTLRFVGDERPDSLAAMVRILASPGSNQNPVSVGSRVRMPRPLDGGFSTEASVGGGDAVFTLAAVVTREGRVANLELLRAIGIPSAAPGSHDAKALQDLLGTASRAHFEPASVAGSPVAVNMVWIVARTTVRATQASLDLPPPRVLSKKRIAGLDAPSTRSVTT